jgi:type I restriction enzyme M protein
MSRNNHNQKRLVALHRRRGPGREQHPPLDHRERLAGGHRGPAPEHVLQHRHCHLHLGADQPQAGAQTGQGPTHRRHQNWYQPLRKNLGKKNCELSETDITRIRDTFLAFEETEQSKIFENRAFGYWKVTVERPLRLSVDLGEQRLREFRLACSDVNEDELAEIVDKAAQDFGPGPHRDYNLFAKRIAKLAETMDVKLTARAKKLLQNTLAQRDEKAKEVIAKIFKPGKAEPVPLQGLFPVKRNGKDVIVEYEPDSELRDTEQIPLLEQGGIEAFLQREVLPHAPDAWYVPDSVKIGYEISFTRYFYKLQPLRTLEEIRADILALEKETGGLLEEIVGTGAQ